MSKAENYSELEAILEAIKKQPSKETLLELESITKPITLVVNKPRLEAIQEIAGQHNMIVTVLNKPGEKYTPSPGVEATLGEGKYFISIKSGGQDLKNFWQEVDKLTEKTQS